MLKQRHRISIMLILTLVILVLALPVSAAQSNSGWMPATVQTNVDSAFDSLTPLYYGQHGWHHRYQRHGHSHDHLRHHERAQHRDCRYFDHDGLYHYPVRHR